MLRHFIIYHYYSNMRLARHRFLIRYDWVLFNMHSFERVNFFSTVNSDLPRKHCKYFINIKGTQSIALLTLPLLRNTKRGSDLKITKLGHLDRFWIFGRFYKLEQPHPRELGNEHLGQLSNQLKIVIQGQHMLRDPRGSCSHCAIRFSIQSKYANGYREDQLWRIGLSGETSVV